MKKWLTNRRITKCLICKEARTKYPKTINHEELIPFEYAATKKIKP